MSTNAALCEDQLALAEAQIEALDDAKIKQDRWDVKKGQLDTEIANIKRKWSTKKSEARDVKKTGWHKFIEDWDRNTWNQMCSQDVGPSYAWTGSRETSESLKQCTARDYFGTCWGYNNSPCGGLVNFPDCRRGDCRNPDSWYDAESDKEVQQKIAQYNMPGRPSLPVVTLHITCQICGQSMDICNVTKSDGTPDVIASNSCLATKISQNQTCNLNVGGESSVNNNVPTSNATAPIPPNTPAPVVASTTTPAPTSTSDDKQKMLLIGGGIGLGVIFLIIMILLLMSS